MPEDSPTLKGNFLSWLVGLALLILVLVGLGVREAKRSVVDQGARFHLLYIDSGGKRVSLVSFDPVEEKIAIVEYPPELKITSRSVGSYEVGSLYTLGAYKSEGGEFARRKVQGFMRLPIVGYLIVPEAEGDVTGALRRALWESLRKPKTESNLSYLDRYYLWRKSSENSIRVIGSEELRRAGIITPTQAGLSYSAERLQTYVGSSLFDWGVGQEGATVALINESGLDGMGSDMAAFLSSLGLDVVMVRSGSTVRESTSYRVAKPEQFKRTLTLLSRVFSFPKYEVGETGEYRAEIVFWVGKDALELF